MRGSQLLFVVSRARSLAEVPLKKRGFSGVTPHWFSPAQYWGFLKILMVKNSPTAHINEDFVAFLPSVLLKNSTSSPDWFSGNRK